MPFIFSLTSLHLTAIAQPVQYSLIPFLLLLLRPQELPFVGKMPAIAALAYHRASGRQFAQPNMELSYAENFLYMLDAGATRDYRPNPRLARAIDIMFTLHAEHEMNCSTAVSLDVHCMPAIFTSLAHLQSGAHCTCILESLIIEQP